MKTKLLNTGNKSIVRLALISFLFTNIIYFSIYKYIINDYHVNTTCVLTDDDLRIYPDYQPMISGYNVENNHFMPINDDPQLEYILNAEKIKGIFVEFDKELESDIIIQVYYAKVGQEIQGDKVLVETMPVHTKQYCIELGPGLYDRLRFDINGECYLNSIYLIKSGKIENGEVIITPRKNVAAYKSLYFVLFSLILSLVLSIKETVLRYKMN